MKPLRVVSLLLVAVGLTLGTLEPARPDRTPQRVGDYFVLSADFHVHAFPGDGGLAAWDLRDEAGRRGLDVIAVTNHHSTLAGRVIGERDSALPLVIPGQEVTAPGYHLVAIGVTDAIDWRLSAADAIGAIHARGGAAVAAHPTKHYWRAYDDAALAAIDGVEVAHPEAMVDPDAARDYPAFYARARAIKPAVAAIGSSDFHFRAPLGLCRTYVFARDISQRSVIDALRQGRTVAVNASGDLVGDPDLVRQVPRDRFAAARARSLWAMIAAACAWLGLLGLILL